MRYKAPEGIASAKVGVHRQFNVNEQGEIENVPELPEVEEALEKMGFVRLGPDIPVLGSAKAEEPKEPKAEEPAAASAEEKPATKKGK